MLVPYKDKFIKVFSLALVFAFLIGGASYYAFYNLENITPASENFQLVKLIITILPWTILISFLLNVWSCYLLAKAKGYPGWLALLAFLNIAGLLILFIIPDKKPSK